MFRSLLVLILTLALSPAAFAKPSAETSLLTLCDAFGKTRKECRCYMDEVRQVYTPADIDLAGGVARSFMSGQEPEAIAAYIFLTRKITITRAQQMYLLGDQHTSRVGKKCEDRNQILTPTIKAKRKAIRDRIDKLGARYRIGQ